MITWKAAIATEAFRKAAMPPSRVGSKKSWSQAHISNEIKLFSFSSPSSTLFQHLTLSSVSLPSTLHLSRPSVVPEVKGVPTPSGVHPFPHSFSSSYSTSKNKTQPLPPSAPGPSLQPMFPLTFPGLFRSFLPVPSLFPGEPLLLPGFMCFLQLLGHMQAQI